MASQIVAIVAVLVGAAGTYVFGRLNDRDRYARELRLRWDQRRLDAYVVYVTAAKMSGAVANAILNMRLTGAADEEITLRTSELANFESRRNEVFEALPLIADGATIEAAHRLNLAVWQLEEPALQGRTLDEIEWLSLADAWVAALNDFHSAARDSLSVVGAYSRRDIAALSVGRPERSTPTQREAGSTPADRP